MTSRKITHDGTLKLAGVAHFIGTSLVGWSVGIKPLANGTMEVFFGRLLLGWINPATESFQRAASRPLEAGQP